MSVGLVLEGGAMRGLYTAGVLDVMMAEQLNVDGIVAVSAGALFGVNYFSGQSGRALRYNLRFAGHPKYMSKRSLLTTGNIVNKAFAYYEVPIHLDPFDEAAFEAYPGTFHVVVTNVKTGQAECHRLEKPIAQMELLRATSAMPYVSRFVPWEGEQYLDGGITESIPLDFAEQLGFDKLIVVLTRPISYRKSAPHKLITKLGYRHYPALRQAIATRYARYNAQVEEIIRREENGEIFVVRPSESLAIKRIETDRKKLQAMYDLGTQDMTAQWQPLQAYLHM